MAWFPDSMIAKVLELDPGTDTIDLDHPDITKDALEILMCTLERDYIPHDLLSPGLIKAGNYLGIDLFELLMDSLYKEFQERHGDILNKDNLRAHGKDMLILSIVCNYRLMFLYLMQREEVDPSGSPLHHACTAGRLEMIEILLGHSGVDPMWEGGRCLLESSVNCTYEIMNLLLSHPKSRADHIMLENVCERGHVGMAKLLIQYIKPVNTIPLIRAASHGHVEMVDFLLEYIDTSQDGTVLDAACSGEHIEVVERLLRDPRIDPQYSFYWVVYNGNLQILELFLAHPRVDPAVHNKMALRLAVSPAVKDRLLQDPRMNP